jgi:hypothetical protein
MLISSLAHHEVDQGTREDLVLRAIEGIEADEVVVEADEAVVADVEVEGDEAEEVEEVVVVGDRALRREARNGSRLVRTLFRWDRSRGLLASSSLVVQISCIHLMRPSIRAAGAAALSDFCQLIVIK